MTILVAGDTHGDQRWLGRAVERVRPTALIHVGDIQLEEEADDALAAVLRLTRFLWVSGNHDYDSLEYYQRLHAPRLSTGNLHARVVVVDGLRIAGLGGWFQPQVWRPPAAPSPGGKPRNLRISAGRNKDKMLSEVRRSGAVWWEDYESLWNQRADVLVCHEAPSCHRHGFRAIDDLAQAMGARRIFHGHHHVTYQDQVAGGIQVYGVGLRSIVDQDGLVIRPGESDS